LLQRPPAPRTPLSSPTRRSSDLTRGLTVPNPAHLVSSGVPTFPRVSPCTQFGLPSGPRVSFRVLLVPRMRDTSVTRLGASVLRKDRKSTRLNSSHVKISYDVVCL